MSKLTDVLDRLNAILAQFSKGTGGQQQAPPFSSQKRSAASQNLGNLSNLTGGTQTNMLPPPPQSAQQPPTFSQKYAKQIGSAGDAWGSFKQAWKSDRAGDIAAGGFGVVQAAGKGIGGPAGGIIEKFGELGKKLGESLERLRRWNEQLYQANTQFAEFSGGMAAVQAEQEVRDIRLSQYRGDTQAGSARIQAEGMASLNQTLAPFESGWANIKNEVTGAFTQGLSNVLEATGLPKAMRAILDFYNKWRFGEGSDSEMMNWMKDIKDGRDKWAELGRPKRFNP
jgi:hypothetical protein